MLEIPANPQPLAERIDKLEREHRNLLTRLEKLEKRSASVLFEIVRTSLLLIVAALLLHLMGLLPRGLERLNVLAKDVQADKIKAEQMEVNELILQDRKGASRARLGVQDAEPGLTFFDASGRVTSEVPAKAKP